MATMLDVHRAKRFLRLLSDEPFVCVVICGEDDVRLFSKGMTPEQVNKIRNHLEEGDDSGEG